MIARLIFIETRRLVTQLRFGSALVLMLSLSIYSVYRELAWTAGGAHIQGAISLAASDWLPSATPLVVGVVAAGSFAEDRRRGYVPLVLARGISRRQYLLAKGTAMALTSALAMLLGCLIFVAIASVSLPAGRTPLTDGVGVDVAGNRVIIPAAAYYPGPVPQLFGYSPVLNDALSILIVMLGAGALASTGLLVGALIANEYIAAAVPLCLVFVALFALFNRADVLSPYTYLDVWNLYRRLPRSILSYAVFIYWPVFSALVVGLAAAIFVRRELD